MPGKMPAREGERQEPVARSADSGPPRAVPAHWADQGGTVRGPDILKAAGLHRDKHGRDAGLCERHHPFLKEKKNHVPW